MKRLRIIVNLFAIAMIIFAAITLRARSRAQHHADRPADPLAILDRRVAAVDFAGTSLPEAAEALSKAAGVRIAVDPAAVELAGRMDAFEIKLDGMTLEENLRQMIFRFELNYVVEPDGIRITTLARTPPVVRIYDVRDLQCKIAAMIPLEALEDTSPQPAGPPVSSVQNSGVIGGFGPPSPPSPPRKLTPQEIDPEAMDQIVALIKDSVAREDWMENGGSVGSIHDYVNGFLAVIQTPSNHRKIIQFLAAIRRADAMQWRDAFLGRPR